MLDHEGLPVAGYRPQSEEKVALVNLNKELEERVLRQLDAIRDWGHDGEECGAMGRIDQRWLAIARSHIEQGFMALNRSVFQPQRIDLAEDDE